MRTQHSENLFYAPFSEGNSTFLLDSDETTHAFKVLRLRPGTWLEVSNGLGCICRALWVETQGANAVLQVGEVICRQEKPKWNLALALLKGDALEEPVSSCTQVEIGEIQLLRSKHCQVDHQSTQLRQLRRLKAKSLESSKQARRAWCTIINEPQGLAEWLSNIRQNLVLLDAQGGSHLPEMVLQQGGWLCVGPEGGFSQEEIALFEKAGAYKLSLGATRLRARCAPLFALGFIYGQSPNKLVGFSGVNMRTGPDRA